MIFLASIYCITASSLFATSREVEGKIYISKDAIELNCEGIYVHVEDTLVPIESIHHDEEGYYLSAEELIEKGHDMWYCYSCRRHHSGPRG